MNGTDDHALQERRKYVGAFNATMVKIWKEKIVMLGVIDTGALYNSVTAVGMTADQKITSVTLSQAFNAYGLYVDAGVGSNTYRGNSGDMGRTNMRQRRRWFSRKHIASVLNLREFFADNLGRDMANTVSNAISGLVSGRFAI